MTVPTGGFSVDLPNPRTGVIDGPVTTTTFEVTLQPFVGASRTLTPHLYARRFASVVVPTDARDATILTSDLGLGYWLHRNAGDRFVQGVVPTVELHTSTPLNKSTNSVSIGFSEQVNRRRLRAAAALDGGLRRVHPDGGAAAVQH
ncbi:MAG: hypothetical protein ACJ8F7_10710 [Gemmataceae bacterium]